MAILLANVGVVGTALFLSILFLVFKKSIESLRAESGSPVFSARLGFLWAFVWVVAINLAARGMAGLILVTQIVSDTTTVTKVATSVLSATAFSVAVWCFVLDASERRGMFAILRGK